jgi:peptidoglycan/LPS O-acetylase OafA/YrhL
MPKQTALPLAIALFVGALIWVLAAVLSGRREPWDSTFYWSIAYPAAILVAGCLGFFFPERPWRWAYALFGAQFVAMCAVNGELGNLWPLGLALLAILALPAVLIASVASRLRNRSHRREST